MKVKWTEHKPMTKEVNGEFNGEGKEDANTDNKKKTEELGRTHTEE